MGYKLFCDNCGKEILRTEHFFKYLTTIKENVKADDDENFTEYNHKEETKKKVLCMECNKKRKIVYD